MTDAAVTVLAEASRRRLTERQVAVVEQLVERRRRRGARARLRRGHRPHRGPPGRRGSGHGVHLLRVQGPSPGRGPVATATGAPRAAVHDHGNDDEPAGAGPGDGAGNGADGGRDATARVIAELRVLGLFMADDPTARRGVHDGAARERARGTRPAGASSARRCTTGWRRARGRRRRGRACAAWTSPTAGPCCGRGMGHIEFEDVPDALADAARSSSGRAGSDAVSRAGREPGWPTAEADRTRAPPGGRAGALQPVRLRDARGPLSHLRPAADRGPAVPQRRVRLLGAVAPRRRARRLPRPRPPLQPLRRDARPRRLRAPGPQVDVVPGHGPAPPHPHAVARVQGLHARAGSPSSSPRSAPWPCTTSTPRSRRGRFDMVADVAGKLPMDVISADDRRPRRRTGPRCGAWPTCSSTARRASSTSPRRGWRRPSSWPGTSPTWCTSAAGPGATT